MEKKLFVTIMLTGDTDDGYPIAAYPTQEAADEAVARSKAAYQRLRELEDGSPEEAEVRKAWTREDHVVPVKSFL